MNDDDFRTRARGVFAEFADEFRKTALALHDGQVRAEALVASMDPRLRNLGIPPRYNSSPLLIDSKPLYLGSCGEAVMAQEELAAGDAGLLLALPWSSMSVFLVETLFSEADREEHYALMAEEPRWTFFAVTEPEHGSDPVAMRTRLSATDDGLVLNGVKRYIGNGSRALYGIVFTRREGSVGPLGIEAIRVPCDSEGFEAEELQTVGLRGAGLSELRFDNLRIPGKSIVGNEQSSVKRGLTGALRTFDIFRPGVGAMALGVARAAYEYVRAERRELKADDRAVLDMFEQRIHGTRALITAAARTIDAGRPSAGLSSSAKLSGAVLAQEMTAAALRLLGPGARLDHPLLDKMDRDARGFELMEGTSDIQRQHVAQGYLANRFWPPEGT